MLGDMDDRGRHARCRRSSAGPDDERVDIPTEARRERERLQREIGGGAVDVLHENEVHDATPICSRRSTTAAAASAPLPRTSACFDSPGRNDEPGSFEALRRALGRAHVEGLAPGAHAPRHRRVPRQVEPFENGDDCRQGQLVDVAASTLFLLTSRNATVDADALQPGRARPTERVRHAKPDLKAAGIGGLVAEEDEVEGAGSSLVGSHGCDDRAGGRLGIPLLAVGDEVDPPRDADRHRVAQLLLGIRRPEREHDGVAPEVLPESHGLLDPALLVRADREAEMLRLDRLLVVGEHDPATRHRYALDADEGLHERILSFSGSNGAVAPATATVTG